jgi:hypothetical protein
VFNCNNFRGFDSFDRFSVTVKHETIFMFLGRMASMRLSIQYIMSNIVRLTVPVDIG